MTQYTRNADGSYTAVGGNVGVADNVVNNIVTNGGKTLEKVALYVMGILQASGAVTFSHLSPTWGAGICAAILAGLHISTPTPKSGPGQL